MISSVNGQPVAEILNQKTAYEKLLALHYASNFEAINYESIENADRYEISFIKAEKIPFNRYFYRGLELLAKHWKNWPDFWGTSSAKCQMLTLNSNNNAHDQANKTNGVEARQITTQDKNEKYA